MSFRKGTLPTAVERATAAAAAATANATELIKLRALLLRQLAVGIWGLILLIHMMADTYTYVVCVLYPENCRTDGPTRGDQMLILIYAAASHICRISCGSL